ncbi:hypothetical protein Poly41_24690 [Novipirellula artificiosorum]|uniref:Uncharacterized protein n=1 Tax=Novipirellula artificiosorum TaxID=2528016 RepID=A0A5C6DTS6_9BACT|nr:hypothetical protein Poly41_24690 [Novipirellula artificiosorum]
MARGGVAGTSRWLRFLAVQIGQRSGIFHGEDKRRRNESLEFQGALSIVFVDTIGNAVNIFR